MPPRRRTARDVTGLDLAPAERRRRAACSARAPRVAPAGNVHVVVAGDTLMSISRRYHKLPLKQIADANHIPPHTHLKIGDRIVLPGRMVASAAPAAPVAAPAAHPAPPAPPPAVWRHPKFGNAAFGGTGARGARSQGDRRGPAPARRPVRRRRRAGDRRCERHCVRELVQKWPLRGRGDQRLSEERPASISRCPRGRPCMPPTTASSPMRAASFKGYGNLILIRRYRQRLRHRLRACERADCQAQRHRVRRGQRDREIGAVTGSVSSPQLHFPRSRKGSTPVDPMQYLPSS